MESSLRGMRLNGRCAAVMANGCETAAGKNRRKRMRQKLGRLLAFGLILCLLAGLTPALAESLHTEVANPALTAEVQLGYDGRITYGKAVPVRVTVRAAAEDLEGTLAVNTYVSRLKYDRYETEISVPAGGERTVVLPVTVQYQQDVFTVEILQSGEKLLAVNASPAGIVNPSAMMIGVLSTRPRNLANLDIDQENDVLSRYEYWQTVALTAETLPEEAELLNAFGMIVLDDVDPAALTEKQQQALKDWIARGHVLLCGGGRTAPQNLAFLGDLTSLRTEDFTVSGSVTASLESFLGQKTSGGHPETALARLTGAEPLAADEEGAGLLWRETVGAGRIYTLAWEAGDAALNAVSMMHPFFQQLLILKDPDLYRNIQAANSDVSGGPVPDDTLPLNVRNPLPAAAVIVASAALLAAGAWFLLRRCGRTGWMWAVLPALALAAAAGAVGLSGASDMNEPAAVTAVNLIQDRGSTVTRYTGVTAAAPRPGLTSWSMEGEDLSALLYDGNDWTGDDEDDAPGEPAALRAIYRAGAKQEVAVRTDTPWEDIRLSAARTEEAEGKVDAEIWMEKDGLHGVVQNNLPWSLQEGAVLCAYGFVKIPALAPGESADFVLLSETAPNPMDVIFENGKIYLNGSASLYGVVSQMLYGQARESIDGTENTLSSMITTAAEELAVRNGNAQNATLFMYTAAPVLANSTGSAATQTASAGAAGASSRLAAHAFTLPAVLADGKSAAASGGLVRINAEVTYRTVGKTGVVFYAPGMVSAAPCVLDAEGLPAGDAELDPSRRYYQYYDLNDLPTFRFTPEDLENVSVERLVISMEEWYLNELKAYVLDPKQKTWTEFKPNTALENPEKYLDETGSLYCQFRPTAADNYVSIPVPTLTLEGMLKN